MKAVAKYFTTRQCSLFPFLNVYIRQLQNAAWHFRVESTIKQALERGMLMYTQLYCGVNN